MSPAQMNATHAEFRSETDECPCIVRLFVTGKNRQRFFRYRASISAAKSVVFAACRSA
jgi:hypothetical protein